VKAYDFPPGFDGEVKNIAIDFDGVIHNSDKGFFDGTCYGEPIAGSIEALAKIAQSFEIIIFTAKAKPNRPLVNGKSGTELVEEWLEKYGIMKYVKEVTSEKPRALLYIDDNGYRFENWQSTLEFMEKM
jgi:ribonucleotide monophosphatase NagD (HAD superfamily)